MLRFLRHNRKDSEYLDHNLDNYVRHSRSRCNPSVNLKPVEEMLDAVKKVPKLVVASTGVFSRLRTLGLKIR